MYNIQFLIKLTLLHSERPKLYGVLAILSAIGLRYIVMYNIQFQINPIALRKTKTLWSFGHSEGNRVNLRYIKFKSLCFLPTCTRSYRYMFSYLPGHIYGWPAELFHQHFLMSCNIPAKVIVHINKSLSCVKWVLGKTKLQFVCLFSYTVELQWLEH